MIRAATSWYQGSWTLRAGLFDLSIVPNSADLIPRWRFQWSAKSKGATISGDTREGRGHRIFHPRPHGRFEDAIQLAALTGGPADIAAVRRYTSRSGISANLEQQISPELGAFARAGIANGGIEPYEFTDIDRTLAAGLQLSGKLWGRQDDTVGIAGVVNGISAEHQAFLDAGGLGILVGDGQLPSPGPERIIETYYSFSLRSWKVTVDYQFITDPGYNRDRGPVSVIGARLHAQF